MATPHDLHAEATLDFRTLYRQCYRLAWWVVRGSGVPEAWVEDVVHDTFLVIHRRLPELDGSTAIRPWVIGIARNAAFSHRRGAARRRARHRAVPEPERPSDIDNVVAYRHAWDRVNGFLGELDAEQREAFVLCELQGVAPAEVAHALRVSRNTVYSRLRLARSKLVEHFSERPRARLPGLLRDARRQGQPTARHKQRTWAALAMKLPLAGLGSASGGATAVGLGPSVWLGTWVATGKAALVSVTLATITLGAIGLAVRASPSSRASPAARAAGPAAPVELDRPTARLDPATATVTPGAGEASPTPIRPERPDAPTVDPPGASLFGPSPSHVAALAHTAHSGSARPLPGPTPPSLDDDIALLRRATQELERGDPTAALNLIQRHAATHPESMLATERLGLRVRALCAAGSTAQAEALAARYVAEHPGTRLAATLGTPCPAA